MREISQHILDLIYNSIEAGSPWVDIVVKEDPRADYLEIRVADAGRGMNTEQSRGILDPFFTTRQTRRVGLGLSLLEGSARACQGQVRIHSRPGKGTTVTARFPFRHIDRQPLGDMLSTLIVAIVGAPAVHFRYRHCLNGKVFTFDTRQVPAEIKGLPRSHPIALRWLQGQLETGLCNLRPTGAET